MSHTQTRAQNYEREALRALELFQGFRNNRVSFGGSSATILPAPVWRQLDDSQRSDCRRVTLQRLIYERFFSTASGGDAPASSRVRRPHSQSRALIAALSVANAGTGSFEIGWEPVLVGGQLCISDGKCWLHLAPAPHPDARPISSGKGKVKLSIPKQLQARSPGFYLAVGNQNLWPGPGPLIRVYFNSTPEGAVVLMGLLTRELNMRCIAFHFKVYTEGSTTSRCDSAVLYLPVDSLQAVSSILTENQQLIRLCTMAGVPPFTLPLLPGVAFAEDPGDGQSFGSSRSMFLANALVRYERLSPRDQCPRSFIDLLESEFSSHGAVLSAPYLRLADTNHFGSLGVGPEVHSAAKPRHKSMLVMPVELPEGCDRIARDISARAIWSRETCTWLGPGLTESHWPELPYRIVGADLYNGTSGVALFLATAWRHLGTDLYATTARGAIRYALSAASEAQHTRTPRAGMFTGWSGVCLAAGMVGDTLGDDALVETATTLALTLSDRDRDLDALDLIDGLYGKIVALSHLGRLAKNPRLQTLTDGYIERLPSEAICSRFAGTTDRRAEYGLAHGRHGRLLALIAAHGKFGEKDELTAHTRCELEYLNSLHQGRLLDRHPSAASTSWCRGSAGHVAATSALPASETNAIEVGKERARIARSLLDRLKGGIGDLGLCHGIAGEASVLAETRPHGLGPGADGLCDIAIQAVTDALLVLLFPPGRLYTLGRFTHPSLMQGLAGVGLFLLQQSYRYCHTPLSVMLTARERASCAYDQSYRSESARGFQSVYAS